MERPPNDHDLTILLGGDTVMVSGHGACNVATPLSTVDVAISEPQLLRSSVSARVQYRKVT